jgi:hypothetical protein
MERSCAPFIYAVVSSSYIIGILFTIRYHKYRGQAPIYAGPTIPAYLIVRPLHPLRNLLINGQKTRVLLLQLYYIYPGRREFAF